MPPMIMAFGKMALSIVLFRKIILLMMTTMSIMRLHTMILSFNT